MAYLLGKRSSPPDEWYQARLAKSIGKTPSELTPEDWGWLAITTEMEWLTQAQAMLGDGRGHSMDADSLLYLKRLRDEANKNG